MFFRKYRIIWDTQLTLILLCSLFAVMGCAASRFHSIDLFMRQQNWKKAQEALEEHIKRNPTDGGAHLLLAEAYGEADRIPEMQDALERARRIASRFEKSADELADKFRIRNFNRGIQHFTLRQFEQAYARLKLAVRIDSSNSEAWQRYGDALFMTARYVEAGRAYKRVLQKKPDDLVLKNNLAEVYFVEKQYQKAIDLCSEILKREEKNLNALMRRAYSYDALDILQEAEQDYLAAIELNYSPDLLTALGLMHFRHEHNDDAIKYFSAALDYSDNKGVQLRYLGEASWRIRDFKGMANWYRKLVLLHPDDVMGWRNLAVAYEVLGLSKRLAEVRQNINYLSGMN